MKERKNRNRGKRTRFIRWLSGPNKTICNRSYLEIALLVCFYTVLTIVVMALLCLKIFVLLVLIRRYGSPWLQLYDSCLGSSPGLGFRPTLYLISPLIWYKWTENEMYYTSYVRHIELFMSTYELADPNSYRDCSPQQLRQHSEDQERHFVRPQKPSYFNVSQLGPCADTSYGYMNLQPCVYLKVNRINDWIPECYNKSSELPAEMPDHLKEYIANEADSKSGMLWVSCEGYYPSDKEHMGNISYYPQPGFQVDYFPYKGHHTYLSPIVAIQFNTPMSDLLITIKCHAWAKNIASHATKNGQTDFQLMLGKIPQPK